METDGRIPYPIAHDYTKCPGYVENRGEIHATNQRMDNFERWQEAQDAGVLEIRKEVQTAVGDLQKQITKLLYTILGSALAICTGLIILIVKG